MASLIDLVYLYPAYFGLALAGAGVAVFFLIKKYGSLPSHVSSASVLERYSRDLISLAKAQKLDAVIGRKNEIQRVIQILCRRTKNNPILIGDAGVGKTALAEGLANAIVEGKAPSILLNKRVLALNLGALLAGTKFRGEFEQRIEAVSREILQNQRAIILFIDEIQNLTQAGEAVGAIGAANLLKPFLARGDLQVIGAATPEDYFKYIQNDTSLERRFQPVIVEEPTTEETKKILLGIKGDYENYHQIKITDEVVDAVVALAGKYLTDRFFPDKAIDLMDEAASLVNLKQKSAVTIDDLEEVIFRWSNDMNKLRYRKERYMRGR